MGGLLTVGQLLLGGSGLMFLLGLWIGYKWLPSLFSKTPAPVRAALDALEEDLTAHLESEVAYVAAKLRASMGIVAQTSANSLATSQAAVPVSPPPVAPDGGRTIG
jgi:hypothetical protein